MKHIYLASLLAILCLVLGCSKPQTGGVFFSQCNNAEPYRAAQNKQLKALFDKTPEIKFVITDAQADAAKQISQIETAIRQKPDVLIVAPFEREPLSAVMGKAMDAGIPVICLERDIAEPNYTTYIKCDNHAIGQAAGKWMVEYLTKKNGAPKGNIVEIRGNPGVEGAINRHGGAHDILKDYPDIKVVHDAVANWFQNEAMDKMNEALTANPADKNGGIDIVYGHNDPMAYGAYLSAKEKGRETEMAFVGVDGLADEGAAYVKDGVLDVTFKYPLCVDKAHEIAMKLLTDNAYTPEKTYLMESSMIDQ